VKAFNGQDQEVWQYFLATKVVTKHYLVQARANALQFGIIKFSAVVLYVSGFWYGLYLVIHGLTVGHVLTTFVSCGYAMQAVEIVLPQFLVLAKGISAGETLKSVMAEMQDGRNAKDEDGNFTPHTCPGDIEINDVSISFFSQVLSLIFVKISFAYPSNRRQNVLSNATFFFPAGETTFLVGKSGSGKSTLSNLLLKYYEVHSGEILIDGQPIQTLNTNWLRQNITLVQQQSVLFNDTIFQNIAHGTPGSAKREEIRQAARIACLEHTIDEMPRGFDTLVGPKHRALSGGQSQRLAIARARLRDTPVLILDESTSALDQMSRIEVINRIREWRKGKTTIIITHDVSQIHDNDYVYVLQNAKVVQEGYRRSLAEQVHGSFARFLRVTEAEDLTSFSHIVTDINVHPSDIYAIESSRRGTLRVDHLPKFYSAHETSSNHGLNAMFTPATRLSLASGMAALAQTNALIESAHWSSPVIPDSPVISRPGRSSIPLMPFMSPRPSPQVPSPVFQPMLHTDLLQRKPSMGEHTNTIDRRSLLTIDESTQELGPNFGRNFRRENNRDIEIEDSINQKPASLATIFRSILPALPWKERLLLVLGLLASVVVGAATPAFSWVFSQLLSTFYIVDNRTELARKWALCMLGIALIDGSAWYSSHYFLEHSGQAWINALRVESLKRILVQPKSWFDQERNSPGQLTECLDRDAEEMRNLLGRFLGLALTIFTLLGISLLWSFVVDWKLTLLTLASAPVMYAITRLFHWSSAKWEGKSDHASGVTSSIFSETFSNIRVVRALTLESFFDRRHEIAIAAAQKIGRTRAGVLGCMFGLTDSLIYYIVALVFYYATVIISSGDATVTRIFIVVNLMLLGTSNSVGMFAMIPQLNSSLTTATQVLRLANLPLNDSHESQGTKRLADPFPIKLNNLSFTYPSRPHTKTLDGISLTIEPGSCTAIVGPSGSGKSTIASILLGLYPPDCEPGLNPPSTLKFAGKSIFNCNIHNIRSHMAIVPQSPILFPATVFSNITYGLPEISPYNNLFSVEHAAMDAGIHDFIMSLENGYQTLIGEGGMGISGGQAQRIAIARALVREPKVLILDEATAALDVESAEGIRDTVKRLRGKAGMAVLIISHNVDMMRIAELVIMIVDGKVVERGAFEELQSRGGAFESLITGKARRPDLSVKVEGMGLGGGELSDTR
jgi:ATP-binding cassette subfamily B (MDR/TAP) protein 1